MVTIGVRAPPRPRTVQGVRTPLLVSWGDTSPGRYPKSWTFAALLYVWHVMTSGKIWRVPNQPRTPKRSIRIPDPLWQAAKAKAAERGEDLSSVVRAALERYIRRRDKPR